MPDKMTAEDLIAHVGTDIDPLLKAGLFLDTTDLMARNGTLRFWDPKTDELYTLNEATGYVRRFTTTNSYKKHLPYPLNPRPSKTVTHGQFFQTKERVLGDYIRLHDIKEQVKRVLQTLRRRHAALNKNT